MAIIVNARAKAMTHDSGNILACNRAAAIVLADQAAIKHEFVGGSLVCAICVQLSQQNHASRDSCLSPTIVTSSSAHASEMHCIASKDQRMK